MATLEKAIELAAMFHAGQVDKGGHAYVLHPLRLVTKAANNDERIVAALHDTIEDTDLTLEDLRTFGFADYIIEAVDCLTRDKHESRSAFIKRISRNELATLVKILDIKDNMDLSRLQKVEDADYKRNAMYEVELLTLFNALAEFGGYIDSIRVADKVKQNVHPYDIGIVRHLDNKRPFANIAFSACTMDFPIAHLDNLGEVRLRVGTSIWIDGESDSILGSREIFEAAEGLEHGKYRYLLRNREEEGFKYHRGQFTLFANIQSVR